MCINIEIKKKKNYGVYGKFVLLIKWKKKMDF